jgi:leucyl aminopeptidase
MFTDAPDGSAVPIHLISESDFDAWRDTLAPRARSWIAANGFRAERGRVCLMPDAEGALEAVAVGLGALATMNELSLWHCAGLADRLPAGDFEFVGPLNAQQLQRCAQGWAYGRYRFSRYRKGTELSAARLFLPAGIDRVQIERIDAACALGRDLINTPACDMTPAALADTAIALGERYGAGVDVTVADELLDHGCRAIHAVGRASSVAPRLIDLTWGHPDAPRVTLVGKGVCFDSGGLDLKNAASMLLMKKDMGGAAVALALALLVMSSELPVRLRLLIPAVENAVSGDAYRPGDVLTMRNGTTVEVGNTDAEGRLVLADALTIADEETPDLLIDLATLTGAARIALGPELPALFCDDDEVAASLLEHGRHESDPLWRLPLWRGYDEDLSSKVADLNNVSGSSFSGAILGALFLRRFVAKTRRWLHIDLYGWNPKERPGRPVGGEAQTLRALFAYLQSRYG